MVCFDERPPIAELAPTDFGQSRPARALRIAITSATAPSVCSSSSTRTASRRKVNVVDSRAAAGFAACMRDPRHRHFSKAARIRAVLDNMSTHPVGALYQAFLPAEARGLLCWLQFHYVPKHASWLSMVES